MKYSNRNTTQHVAVQHEMLLPLLIIYNINDFIYSIICLIIIIFHIIIIILSSSCI